MVPDTGSDQEGGMMEYLTSTWTPTYFDMIVLYFVLGVVISHLIGPLIDD